MMIYLLFGISIGVSLFSLGVSAYLLRQNHLQDVCNNSVMSTLETLKTYVDKKTEKH